MTDWPLVAAVAVVAAVYASVGHAGATGYIAVMTLWGLAPEVIRPTALLLNVIVATITTVQFARAGHFDRRLLLPLAVASVPAAASEAKPVTVRASSLTHQANLPPGWIAKCRGPAPTATDALPWGASVARSASSR